MITDVWCRTEAEKKDYIWINERHMNLQDYSSPFTPLEPQIVISYANSADSAATVNSVIVNVTSV